MRSHVVEDYLTMIFKLIWETGKASTSSVAKEMEISQASVTEMFKKMANAGLITHTPYRGVTLTSGGEKIALEVIRHHRLVELYLHETMEVSWDKVHDEAHKWEHILSEEIEDKIVEMLDNPTHDPHGAPIPTKDGYIDPVRYEPLSDARKGDVVIVKRVNDADAGKLRFLANIGLFPDTEIHVVAVEPNGGDVTIEVADNLEILDKSITDIVYVASA